MPRKTAAALPGSEGQVSASMRPRPDAAENVAGWMRLSDLSVLQ